MASRGAEAARTSLDSRAPSGDAADRPYVTSMLRRLGYTDAQIADYLAGRGLHRDQPVTLSAHATDAPAPPAAQHPTKAQARKVEAADRAKARDIEVEYTGPGLRDYRLVVARGVAALEPVEEAKPLDGYVFEQQHDFGKAEPAPAPEPTPEPAPEPAVEFVEVPLTTFVEEPPVLVGFVEEGEPAIVEEPPVQLSAEPAGFPGWEQDGWRLYRSKTSKNPDPLKTHRFARVDDKAPRNYEPAYVPEGHEVGWDEKTAPYLLKTVPAPFPGWEENGWRLYRSDAATAEDDPVATHQFARADQPAPEGHAPAHLPEGHDVAWSEAGEPSLVKAAEPAEPAFKEEGWNLYSKDEGEGDNAQRIFFFSRESPEDAVPAEVPEGYEVAVNPETGRPFLRRIQDADPDAPIESAHPAVDPAVAGRKRVRIVRVRAADRDAAQRKLEGEGRHVLATMPIDIEKRVQ